MPVQGVGDAVPDFGQGTSPIFIARSGQVSAGSGDPGPTSHFMVFRPSSNALWGTVLTVPKACKDTTSQNPKSFRLSPIPPATEFPFGAYTTKNSLRRLPKAVFK